MITEAKVNEVMNSSIGSMTFYKREYGKNMDYTEGVMEVQRQLGMYWFVDMMYSHMPAVVEDHNKTEETFLFFLFCCYLSIKYRDSYFYPSVYYSALTGRYCFALPNFLFGVLLITNSSVPPRIISS